MTVLKHFLAVSLLFLSETSLAQSNNDYGQYKVVNGDTMLTNFPLKTARKAAYKSELLKEYMIQVDSLNAQIGYLEEKIDVEKTKNGVTVEHYEGQLALMKEQKDLLLNTIAALNKDINRLKRSKKWTAIGGTAGMILVGILSLKK